jgi:hypothetical protein
VDKVGVPVASPIGSRLQPLESPQVQLSSEGSVLGLLEIPRHDMLCKELLFVHPKGYISGHPGNNVGVPFDLCITQQFMDLPWKRKRREGSVLRMDALVASIHGGTGVWLCVLLLLHSYNGIREFGSVHFFRSILVKLFGKIVGSSRTKKLG